jgi:hypothetical protein
VQTIAALVGSVAGVLAVAVYAWYLWSHCGLREWVLSFVASIDERNRELDQLRRMWGDA